jgi:hypothetical protein
MYKNLNTFCRKPEDFTPYYNQNINLINKKNIGKKTSYLPAYEDGTNSVPKSWHIEFRRREITQKKTYNKTSYI